MKELKLMLTIEETDLILEALGGMPFKKVYVIIQKIQDQASKQLPMNGEEEAKPTSIKPSEREK